MVSPILGVIVLMVVLMKRMMIQGKIHCLPENYEQLRVMNVLLELFSIEYENKPITYQFDYSANLTP